MNYVALKSRSVRIISTIWFVADIFAAMKSISNIAFTIMKTFWIFYSVDITLFRYPENMDDDCGNDNLELEEDEAEALIALFVNASTRFS